VLRALAICARHRLVDGTQAPYGSSAIMLRPAPSLTTAWMSPSDSWRYWVT
jgi:hypothetical protein